ncbi:hypothetical protein Plim_0884 [Planctopirus limnophila DSM 3776]|uniref:Uncharacterized protein n=1 Tax=Planctopirus limnophila (strain ATCC 43296 / DSM 3776 / IFAM 1008 / Mu 290) TaxID=521674 RepID=D5SSI0_PLAL2|nr:ankyrin repeat domain-containing protein [Planctopirus limnophila]ADG66728.1 hypothetical protein Plim_0884 [Planctopirus limnophila DSM 3776]
MDIENIIENGTLDDLNDYLSKHSHNAEELNYALSEAIWFEKAPMIVRLLEVGAPINMFAGIGMPPLYCAIEKGDLSLVKMLCEHGADVNFQPTVMSSPLHWAVDSEADCARQMGTKPNVEIVRLLLEYGADPNSKNKHGTPYDMAQRYGFSKACELLKPQQ